MEMLGREPGGHGQVICVAGDVFCVSGSSGQIRPGDAQGFFVRDVRHLDRLLLRVDGAEPQSLEGQRIGASAARFAGYLPSRADAEPDPRLLVDRRRVVSDVLREEITLSNYGIHPTSLSLEVEVGVDFAHIFDVKHGRPRLLADPEPTGDGLRFAGGKPGLHTVLRATPRGEAAESNGRLCWQVDLPARSTWKLTLEVGGNSMSATGADEETPEPAAALARPSPAWRPPRLECSDRRLSELVAQSVADLAALLMPDPEDPADRFFAAGSPWFLTLFGRDALWSAFMALPLDVAASGQALRVLARRQGTRSHEETEEAPGKILHEVRHGGLRHRSDLPPVYYGSVDATPLFVILLEEAWRWGLPQGEVVALLPAAMAALDWLRDHGDPDGDGFVEYVRSGERGLANQGWKDSHDGVQFADGTLAEPPVALCEVQGYAYRAAVAGADLLDRFGRPGADEWRSWAERLRTRFRDAFWVPGAEGAYPAMALDGRGRRVDGIGSNMGHLPATGLLDPAECELVARRLSTPDMNSGWGLRTLTSRSPRFNPLSYHGGSVWPHDTAIAVYNLAVVGAHIEATGLLKGFVAAAPSFDYRMPELFGGEQRDAEGFPLPYPAACQPQAWSAAASLLLMRAIIGLHPHVPDGRLLLRPMWPPPFRRLRVEGLEIAGGRLSLTILRGRGIHVDEHPARLSLTVEGAPRLAGPPPV